ncbi:MAG: hypothetical protein KBS65_02895 [Prevotella sp.]|nr:hypothetical protein [Candidatus Equicola stercoris]
MTPEEKARQLFETRVRQLILTYREQKDANVALREKLKEKERDIDELRTRVAQMQDDFNALKIARMVELETKDLEMAKKRLGNLVREVNHCITLIKESKE